MFGLHKHYILVNCCFRLDDTSAVIKSKTKVYCIAFLSVVISHSCVKVCLIMTSKRKRLSIQEKNKILDDCKNGLTLKTISVKYGVPKSTICTIKSQKENILRVVGSKSCKKRFNLTPGEFPIMENKLYRWFLRARERHISVNALVLKAEAQKFHKKYYNGSFLASDGWLTKFKKRFGIRLLTVCGEKLSASEQLVNPFKTKLAEIISTNELSLHAIFNADETGLFYRMLPTKTYVHSAESSAPGRKTLKERVTVLLCANATGEKKIKPLIIGKSQKLRSFRNKVLPPVNYAASKSAWMTTTIFKYWFFNNFVPQVEHFLRAKNLPLTALLILDNAPSHPPADQLVKETKDGRIWTIFMPPNVTPLVQPMDQNAIRLVKLNYRNSLLKKVSTNNLGILLKKFSVYEAICLLSNAWSKLSSSILQKCWSKILMDLQFEDEDDIPLAQLRNNEDISCLAETLNLLTNISQEANYTSDDVNEWVNIESTMDVVEDVSDESSLSEVESLPEIQTKVAHKNAVEHLKASIQWASENNIDYSKIMILQELQEEAFKKSVEVHKKQSSLLKYFK